ncbi:MAG: ATP-binding protein [Ignavibacterium sp.]|jgi:signal transduction histidine kinase|nr:ATP-binding protein [Ignavibacterium sp.]MDX9713258.1 ATP-binding protein [Ignavibacteriaceae bacterium]MEB2354578.1 ATP-binding protein [Ignavibacteriales bacterium]
MKSALTRKSALLLIEIIIIIVCIGGFYLNVLKPNLPFEVNFIDSHLIITNVEKYLADIKDGSILLSVDTHQFNDWEELELYLDGKRIGETVNIKFETDKQIKFASVQLTNYYSLFTLIIIAVVGLIYVSIAMFVRIRSTENYSARLFHRASISLGMVIVSTAGTYNLEFYGYGYLNRIIWLFIYSLTPVLFIHFTSSFAKKKVKGIKYILWYFYLSALVNSIILSYLFLEATLGGDFDYVRYYVLFFDSFFRLFLITCIIIAISVCIYAYRSTREIDERKRLQWLLLGYFIGPFSFVIFWVIPIFFLERSLLPESVILIFLTAIPITFSIAIVKYHLMDVNLIIRRSFVYTVVLFAIIITYVLLTSVITFFVDNLNPAVPTVLTAIATVVLLQPAKNLVQKFVDKKFFRVEYDYRKEQQRFFEEMKNIYDVNSLAELIIKNTDQLIPVNKIGFFNLDKSDSKIRIISDKGFELLHGRSIRFETENLKNNLVLPVAVSDKVEAGINIESADVRVFKRWGITLVFPIKSPTGIIHAFLVLGEKKAGTRYYKDDIDLLSTVTAAAALAIDRIILQEDLIRQKLEAERLEELNELKSFFMQGITHELKTPLTSIKIFTEKLKNHQLPIKDKSDFYLKVINGESNKLNGLIDNILVYAQIEKGMQTYQKSRVNLIQIVHKAVSSVQYQFMMKKQKLEVVIANDTIDIFADEKAVESAILNLLTNASKYSCEESKTILSVTKVNNNAIVEVIDNGRGISSEDLKKVFEPFVRLRDDVTRKIEGTGLGLAIVKHIMDEHCGRIEIKSELGKGSSFSLYFKIDQ